ncbi:unnamed protein product [Rhizoctonia solani]|uniref:Peptidase M43 pregnancy-associated plasma-A domain-containing protein n=1 Tax=Rhizoctonia solani TaxID=456999 RepID=A0A8H2WCH5_9AGAM|nr:unnamed protein product [Rhizoctonia solani]
MRSSRGFLMEAMIPTKYHKSLRKIGPGPRPLALSNCSTSNWPTMLFTILATLTLSFASVLAQADPTEDQFTRCGSIPSEAEVRLAELSFLSKKKASKTSQVGVNAEVDFNVVIPVHWHTITSGKSIRGGYIPISQITESIKVLNNDFSSTGFSFKLESSEYIANEIWYDRAGLAKDPRSPEYVYQTEMKQSLRLGGVSTLNIYSTGFTNTTNRRILGFGTFPSEYEYNPVDDGVVVRCSTVPGGSFYPFNQGKTLTHEVGHWLGLYHTFQGGCRGNGDLVSDTPAHLDGTNGCPTSLPDTCPHHPGHDPIHNFMDYSDDSCLNEFTPGQIRRMRDQFMTYRVESESMEVTYKNTSPRRYHRSLGVAGTGAMLVVAALFYPSNFL